MWPNTKDWVFDIIGIDPGSKCTGYSIYTINSNTLDIIKVNAFTVEAYKSNYYSKEYSNTYNDKYSRFNAMNREFMDILEYYRPAMVFIESPFFNSFTPNAFSVLTELLQLYKLTLIDYNNRIPFITVDPPTAKKSIGAKGNAKKDDMTLALDRIKDSINLLPDINLLDEHSIDACAIGYWGYINYIKRT